MNINRPELRELLARRYVLGTMGPRARRRFGLWMDEVPAVEDAVLAVEADLSPLGWSLPAQTPSQLTWRRVQARMGRPSAAGGAGPQLRGAAVALALALLAMAGAWWQSTTRPPVQTALTEPAAGIVANAQGEALWLVRLYADQARASISVALPPTPQPNNDYQLWILRDDGVPVSLGLMPQSGEASLALSAAAQDALARGRTLAVSLEPVGGSPEAAPTGPVLYTAPVVGG